MIRFNNGIYNLNNDKFIFKKYFAGEKTLNVDYFNYNPNEQDVLDVYQFLDALFPNKNIRDFFLKKTAQVLLPNNPDNIIFWYGTGNNGKTTMLRLLNEVLGDLLFATDSANKFYRDDFSYCLCQYTEEYEYKCVNLTDNVYKNQTRILIGNCFPAFAFEQVDDVVIIEFSQTFDDRVNYCDRKIKELAEAFGWILLQQLKK